MKSLKYHISVILPLFVLLFSVESFNILSGFVKEYEKKLSSDYSIVVVSKVPLDKKSIVQKIGEIESVKIVNTDKVVNKLKDDNIGQDSLKKLKSSLPLFYNIKLKFLPKESELKKIKSKLEQFTGVQNVVIFKNSYNKFYNFLIFNKMLLMYFTFLVSAVVFLLIIKQTEIWIFEQKQRFEIMSILGAPFWMKSAMLYRVVIVDAIISFFLVVLLFFYLLTNQKFILFLSKMGISIPTYNMWQDAIMLFCIGVVISIISVTFAIYKLNKE